jgi:hypothetical protein
MKARAITAGLLMLAGIGAAAADLAACGDKFLMPALCTRYERSPAARQAAALLVFAEPGSDLSRVMSDLSVEAVLRREGYRPKVVASATELAAALRASVWDVVVVDGRDRAAVVGSGAGVAPRVVPVLGRPSKDELKAVRKQYGAVVNAPTKGRTFVETIDEAMDLHDADVRAAAKKAFR